MKLSELIAHVGGDNIQCQGLTSSFVAGKVKKHDGEITFATDRAKVMALCGVGKPTHQCMIVWLPIDKLPDEVPQMNATMEAPNA